MHARPLITSTSNARLKELRRQAARPGRARGTVLVEGYRLLLRAVEAAAAVETVYAAPALFAGPDAGTLVDRAERPGNLGTIVRTADAAGATALLACDPQVDVFQPKTVNASVGGVFRLPVAVAATETAIAWLRERGIVVAVATPDGDVEPWAADLRGPTALVLGSEKRGVSQAWLEAADVRIGIPMPGGGPDSLNVGVAAGVLLVEAARQRLASRENPR